MKKFIEGSFAMAQAAKLCRPQVIAAYPITPQTHIVEHLSQFIANGELSANSINVESEHSAASCVLGAQAAGARSFTCTSSQGLILMSEVLFCMAGMRLPVVMICANRALSAPINIWNDHQDSIAVRDAGWIQLYAENNQEAVDLIIAGHKIAEKSKVMLPAMVCVDGFILTHGMEVVDIPEQKEVDAFLPPYKPPYKLDINNPMSFGLLGDPSVYQETRYAIQKTLEDVVEIIPQTGQEYKNIFGRDNIALIEEYKTEDADTVLVAMGSVCGTIKDVVDRQRQKGNKTGLLKIISYRPFPKAAVKTALGNCKNVGVIDKNISLGSDGALYSEIRSLLPAGKKTSGFIAGLGGRDITPVTVKNIIELTQNKQNSCRFVDLDNRILWDEFKTV